MTNEDNSADDAGTKTDESTEQTNRDNKGRFAPQPSEPQSPEPTPEPPKESSPPEKDELLDEIEADLTEALKGRVDPKDLKGLDQRMRIKMLRILTKVDNGKRKDTIDPTQTGPPEPEHIPTLAELNRADKYRADMRKQDSYVGRVAKWRQGK